MFLTYKGVSYDVGAWRSCAALIGLEVFLYPLRNCTGEGQFHYDFLHLKCGVTDP